MLITFVFSQTSVLLWGDTCDMIPREMWQLESRPCNQVYDKNNQRAREEILKFQF